MAIPFTWFLALYYHLLQGVFPVGAAKDVRRKIHYQAAKLEIAQDGRVLEVSSQRELLHEANALRVVQEVHEEGHLGILGTLSRVNRYYVVTGAKQLVTAVVNGCKTCQFRARVKFNKVNLGAVVRTPAQPMFMVGVDADGPLPVTARGNRYILTAVCHLTRWPMAVAVPDINEVTTGEFYLHEIIRNFGVPQYLLSDRGQNFISVYIRQFLKEIGCKGVMTTSRRPNTNGICERMHYTLTQTIAKLSRGKRYVDQWDQWESNNNNC